MCLQRTLLHMQMQLKCVAVLLFLMTVLQFLEFSDALKAGDVGTCIVDVAGKKWETSVYKVKKCPKYTRECSWKEKKELKGFNPKTQKCCAKKVTIKQPICCQGWDYSKEKDICRPLCHPACIDGECIGPNLCKCEPNLVLNGTKCITPVCEPACVNGLCRENNTCECKSEFLKFNSTHCVKNCQPGFKNDPVSLECVPNCDSPCLNGKCTAPNICTCSEGFVQKDNLTCVPECTPSCVNGNCTGPNICTCNEGYHPDAEKPFSCLPKCEPDCGKHSRCIEPDKCQCLHGYETPENTSDCKPVCEKCFHGECVAPDQCQCNPGYSKEGNACLPQCPDINCTYGVCSEPNTCTCSEGYDFDVISKTCEPVCQPACKNSTCRYPGMCVCYAGYETTDNPNVCKPYCGRCENGVCIAPDICFCKDGSNATDGKCPMDFNSVDCETCKTNCSADYGCYCSDGRPCYYTQPGAPAASTTWLAGFQLTWTVAGAIALLLVIMLVIVMAKLYRRQRHDEKVPDQNSKPFNSVVFTVPDTLIKKKRREDEIDDSEEMVVLDASCTGTSERLLTPEVTVNDDFFNNVCGVEAESKQTPI